MSGVTKAMSEADLQRNVIDLAHLLGWKVAHFRSVPVQHAGRVVYETPVQADGAGFPDLVMVRECVLFAELKSERGRLSAAQQDWLFALGDAAASTHVWFPRDWTEGMIEAILRDPA